MKRMDKVTITVPTHCIENGKRVVDKRTIEGRRVTLPGYETISLIIHRAIATPSKWTITEESTGLSLCQDYERRTTQVETLATLAAKFERYSMTPETLQRMIDRQRTRA